MCLVADGDDFRVVLVVPLAPRTDLGFDAPRILHFHQHMAASSHTHDESGKTLLVAAIWDTRPPHAVCLSLKTSRLTHSSYLPVAHDHSALPRRHPVLVGNS